MTLKAVRIIKECPVIAAPRTKNGNMIALSIAGQVVDMTEKTVIPLDFPMKQDNTAQHENHCRIAEQLAVYLGNGQDIAMLNIGDVSLYSSCTYIAAELVKMGFETKMCAGVPSFCAAAAELNIPLSEGSEPLTIMPAQYEAAREMLGRDGTISYNEKRKEAFRYKGNAVRPRDCICCGELRVSRTKAVPSHRRDN